MQFQVDSNPDIYVHIYYRMDLCFQSINLLHFAPPIVAWKLMKIAADEKKRKGLFQQALHEYGQLLKHPYMFGKTSY